MNMTLPQNIARSDKMNQAPADVLEIKGIAKRFGGHTAVHPIDLTIRSGEFITLLGPSGCGKTTLLRMIAGLEHPSAGRLISDGLDITDKRPEHRRFNMVFQSYALFPHLNVFENVAYGLFASGQDRQTIAAKVEAALEMVGLWAHRDQSVAELSGGMSQRVALVRAIVNEPKILLLDEPLAALDLQLRKRMQIELRSIQQRLGTTFILVTHDQEEALVMSDRIVVMQAGRVEQVGTPKDVYRRPKSRFVADFIGETTLLGCTVTAVRGQSVDVEFPTGKKCSFQYYGDSGVVAGDTGSVSLRPEELCLVHPKDGSFSGVVSTVRFVGSATRLGIHVAPDVEFQLVTQEDTVWSVGDWVGIEITPCKGVFIHQTA